MKSSMDTNFNLIFAAIIIGCLSTNCNAKAQNSKKCIDIYGINVKEGQPYIPGPSKCKICKCVNGNPKACRNLKCDLAPPPKNCLHWTEECCEYTCHEYDEEYSLPKWVFKHFHG